jgi:hypothetical protein
MSYYRRSFIYFLILFSATSLLSFCIHTEKVIFGTYSSPHYNLVKRGFLFLKYKSFVQGSSLTLNPDYSYTLINCGNIENGHWLSQNDSLYLNCEKNNYRIDSLNGNWPFLLCDNFVFKIDEDGSFTNKSHIKNFGNVLFELVKISDSTKVNSRN